MWRLNPEENQVRRYLLTDILLLELSGKMSLHEGGFAGASIPYEDELQESIRSTLVPTGFATAPEKNISNSRHSQPSFGATCAFIHRNKCRLCNQIKYKTNASCVSLP